MTPKQVEFVVQFWSDRLKGNTENLKSFQKALTAAINKRGITAVTSNPSPASTLDIALDESGIERKSLTAVAEVIMNHDGSISIWENNKWHKEIP